MIDEKKLDLILERFYDRFNKYNTKVLRKLGNVIKQFEGLTPTQAHILAQELKYSTDIDELLNDLSQLSGQSVKDIEDLFEHVAKENVEVAEQYYKFKNQRYIPYEENYELRRLVDSIARETDELFYNLSKSQNIGFSLRDEYGNIYYKPLRDLYNDLIDEAVYNSSIGVVDYQSAMRNVMRQLADSGVKIHEEKVAYESGYNRRIDSSVRQNVLTGIRKINIGVQQIVGSEIGADGIEISAHTPCAEDHLEINGQQYKARQGETLDQLLDRINSHLDRPIGEYNCRHFAFSIVWGVSRPDYTKEQLERMKKDSLSKVEYDGKTYTKYEATQVQRQLETAIRKQKDRQIIARASGNKDEVGKAQQKISQLTYKYNDFSKKAGLDTYKNRLSVSGYRRIKTNK